MPIKWERDSDMQRSGSDLQGTSSTTTGRNVLDVGAMADVEVERGGMCLAGE